VKLKKRTFGTQRCDRRKHEDLRQYFGDSSCRAPMLRSLIPTSPCSKGLTPNTTLEPRYFSVTEIYLPNVKFPSIEGYFELCRYFGWSIILVATLIRALSNHQDGSSGFMEGNCCKFLYMFMDYDRVSNYLE
jgi:hypothetical protein